MKKLVFLIAVSILITTALQAQNKTIKGQVVEQGGTVGIPFVSVFGMGTTIGTTTDFDGYYTITLPETVDTLVFSFVGYKTKKILIGNQTTINTTMSEDVKTLEAVVVVGYGTLKKEDITSSIAVVGSEDLASTPNASFESAIQGKAAGVLVQNASGKLGEGIKVRVRGTSSISAGNEPLYVIDGIPISSTRGGFGNNQQTNPIADINPNDIASISILKDASAAAIYGSRAANGVILITTKKGEEGSLKVDVDYQFGISETPNRLEMMSARDFKRLQTENAIRQIESTILGFQVEHLTDDMTLALLDQIIEAGEFYTKFNGVNTDTVRLPAQITNNNLQTDWQDQIFKTGISHQANVSISGGKDKGSFYTSLSYLDQKGILVGNEFQRLTGRLSYNYNASEKVRLKAGVNISTSINDRLNEDADTGSPLQALGLPPADGFDPVTFDLINFTDRSTYYNPLQEQAFSTNETKILRTIGNFSIDYQILPDLRFTSDFGVDITDEDNRQFQGQQTFDGSGFQNGLMRVNDRNIFNYINSSYLTYDQSFRKSALKAVIGVSYENTETTFKSERAGIITEIDPENVAFLSSFLRLNYSIESKYLFQASIRNDGSSKFGENNRFGVFPSVSAGWNISKEEFLAQTKVSNLKLKASYGIIGNTPSDANLVARRYGIANYGANSGVVPIIVPNADLKWEPTSQLDIGIDYGFFDQRLNGSLNYYRKNTKDLLFPRALSSTSGFSFILDNVGEVENSGIEFSVNADIVDNEKFSWTTSFNITKGENKVTKLIVSEIVEDVNAAREGEELGFFYLREFAGVNSETGAALYRNEDGSTTENYIEAPLKAMGSANPDFFGGLSNRFKYQNFDMSFNIQFFLGQEIYNKTAEEISNSGSWLLLNQTADQNGRWLKPGDQTDIPVLNPNQTFAQSSSRYLEDGSYYRLRNVTIGYTFPEDRLLIKSLRTMRIFISGQNLLTITNYSGLDPEVNFNDIQSGSIGSNLTQGVDYYSTPVPRTYLAGIKIGF